MHLLCYSIIPSGVYDFGRAFLCTLSSLVPFLERELVDTLPYVVSSTLTSFPPSLVDDVVDVLCWQLLPFTVCGGGPEGGKPVDNFALPNTDEELLEMDVARQELILPIISNS